jgi:50S ribosomal subunit-associated GTPase HflX
VREADLLLHVVDISHPDFEDHIESVNNILQDIKSNNKPTIMVFNKIDAYRHLTIDHDDLITEKTKKHYTLEEWKQTWMHDVGAKTRYSFRLRKGKFRGIPRTRVRSCAGNPRYTIPLQQIFVSRLPGCH